MNCEECEDEGAELQCIQCGQVLCVKCDKKIHNKGNRLLHIRQTMASPTSQQSQFDAHSDSAEHVPPTRKIDAHRLRHQQHQDRFNSIQLQQKNNFTQNQNINQEESRRSNKRLNLQAPSLVLSDQALHHAVSVEYFPLECVYKYNDGWQYTVEHYMRGRANNGDLMIPMDEFRNYLKNRDLLTKLKQTLLNNSSFKDLLSELEKQGLVHVTTRIFGDSEPIKFISLQLEDLSLEALLWILRAIRKDEMTPTDKLIQSRIKECLGMKLPTNEWNSFFQSLQKMQDQEGFVVQTIRGKLIKVKISKCAFELAHTKQLENSSLLSSSQQDSLFLITLDDGIEWKMSDAPQLSSEHKLIWKNFIKFLKDFFDGETSTDGTYQEISDQAVNSSNASSQKNSDFKWIRSVENGPQTSIQMSSSLQINQSYLSQPNNNKRKPKKGTVKPPKSIQKAIPGGKYGCAQLLKCCGPLELKVCSLGMLSLLIQEAIARGILIYYKTLLIKPNQNVAFDFNNYLNIFDPSSVVIDADLIITIEKQRQLQDQQEKIDQVRQVVIEILQDQSRGVSLARLPKMIQRRLTFQFDLHELGYTKLKSFMLSIPEISIENDGTTYASGILKNTNLQNDQLVSPPTTASTLNSMRHGEMSPNNYNKKFSTLKEESSKTQGQYFQRNLSNVQDYQNRTDICLQQILTSHPFGLASQQLLSNLNQMLQSNFDHTLFGTSSFEEYLVKHAEAYADVMVKSRGCFVYPKGMQGWAGWTLQQQQAYYQQTIYKQQFSQINPYQNMQQQNIQNPQNQIKYQQVNKKALNIHHQKSQSSNISGNYLNNQSTSGIIKADSSQYYIHKGFIAGMQQHHTQDIHSNQSLTFHSVNSNPINKEFFMIQEEESHLELDENLKFIEELLKESDDHCQKNVYKIDEHSQKQQNPPQMVMSMGGWPWSPGPTSKAFGHAKTNSNYLMTQSLPPSSLKPQHSSITSLQSWDFDSLKEDKS